jgi:hypothetical protein
MGRKRKSIPPREDVNSAYANHKNINKAGESMNVSGETFRQWLIHYGIDIGPRGVRNNAKGWGNAEANTKSYRIWERVKD